MALNMVESEMVSEAELSGSHGGVFEADIA